MKFVRTLLFGVVLLSALPAQDENQSTPDYTVAANVQWQAAITKLLGAPFEENPAAYAHASPISYVSPDDPPLLMFHGDGDTLVPFSQSERMREADLKAGLKVELARVGNANRDLSLFRTSLSRSASSRYTR